MSLKGGGKMYNKNEIWKDICFIENNIIYNYKGLYKVSNIGRIKSLIDNHGNRRDKILKVIKDKDGYLMVNLYKNKKGKRLKVHRLVAHMFVDGYFDGAEVDHINTIRDDNRVENLRWVTKEENMNNPLTKENQKITNKRSSNPNSKMVICIFPDGNEILFKCKEDLKDYLSIGRGTIDRIIKSGEQYKPRKKKFEYLNGIKIIKVEESDINGK